MRILFVSQLLPLPLDAGPKVRAYYVLRHLVESGHDVTLVSFVRSTDRPEDVRELERLCRRVETVPLVRSRLRDVRDGLRSLVSAKPFLILRDRIAAMDERLARVTSTDTFDAIHADQLWMAPAVAACRSVEQQVLDQHNAVCRVPEQLARHDRNPVTRTMLTLEAKKLGSFERSTIKRFDNVVWVSSDDRDVLRGTEIEAEQKHSIIPIAVDPGVQQPLKRPAPFRVTFLGGLHWPPNADAVRWFLEEIWPGVVAAVPDCVFTVIGKESPGISKASRGVPQVDVRGFVTDIEPLLAETAVFVVPLRSGAGMRVKILDAWCRALPIVSTSVGAEGIDAVDGENACIADTAASFRDRVIHVWEDKTLSRRIAEGGRSTVESCYDWRRTYEAWNQIYH